MEDLPKPWQILCEQAAREQNPERLMALVKEISRLLDEQLQQQQAQRVA